jgi:hypothetical protein
MSGFGGGGHSEGAQIEPAQDVFACVGLPSMHFEVARHHDLVAFEASVTFAFTARQVAHCEFVPEVSVNG